MAKSHPTYNQFGKHMGTIQERCKKADLPDAWSKEGIALREALAKKHGRAWYLFNGKEMRHNRQKTWIEQYHVPDPTRPRGKGRYKKHV